MLKLPDDLSTLDPDDLDDLDLNELRKAPWKQLRLLLRHHWTLAEKLYPERKDKVEELLAFANEAAETNETLAELLRAAAIAQSRPVKKGLEDNWMLSCSARLNRAALEALGPARADAVVRRSWHRYDEPEHADYQAQAWPPVLESLGPHLSVSTVTDVLELLERTSEFDSSGQYLAASEQNGFLLPLMKERWQLDAPTGVPGVTARGWWGKLIRQLLVVELKAGRAPEEAWDEVIGPHEEANDFEEQAALLQALPLERAERLVSRAWKAPENALRFLRPDFTKPMLERLAAVVVSLRKSKDGRSFLRATDLSVLGRGFDKALESAATGKGKAASAAPKKLAKTVKKGR